MFQLRPYTVYMHINKINGKKYIGITMQEPKRRWKSNGLGYKRNIRFYGAIQKYGWDNFEHVILKTGLSEQEAINEEVRLIKLYDTTHKGYNVSPGGDTVSEHTRRKLSKSLIGRVFSEEHKKRISQSKINPSKETR